MTLEGTAVVLFVGLWVALAIGIVNAIQIRDLWWLLATSLTLGYFSADLASGVVHWFCDTFFQETTPIIGKMLIQPFREHHRDPQAMVGHGFLELTGNSCLAVIPVLLLTVLSRGATPPGKVRLLLDSSLLFFSLAVFLTNHLHRWAHAPAAPRAVRWLQHRGWILRPEHHKLHHLNGYDQTYCVTTGWLNPVLDRWGVFSALERGWRGIARIMRRGENPSAS